MHVDEPSQSEHRSAQDAETRDRRWVQTVRIVRGLLLVLLLVGCARDGSAPSSKPLRVGHTYSNGNCALDSENKLTGLCMASNSTGTACTTHAPAPDSPPCTPGLIVNETRAPACPWSNSQETVSREHQCYFLNE